MTDWIRKYAKGDSAIWGIIIFLSIVSLLSVYSATGFLAYKYQGGNTSYYMFRQLFSLAIGFSIIIIVHNINYRWIARFSLLALYLAILLLIATLIAGVNLNMASRWLTIPIIGITFQPSEMAKLALIIYVAKVLAQNQDGDREVMKRAFKSILFYVILVSGLIFSENLSTSILLACVCMAMMFIGRIPIKFLLLTGGVALILLALVLLLAPKLTFLARASTWSSRVEQYVGGGESRSDSYQITQSKIAIASGGFFGKGPGNSVQRNFLPHPYSDFIYALVAEEYGFVGAMLVLLSYFYLLGRVGVIVRSSERTFPAFLALGLGLMLVSQAFVNMGVAVGIFPVTGQPLPLVSLGTTSILFTCVSFGMILGVSRNNIELKGKSDKESVDDTNAMQSERSE